MTPQAITDGFTLANFATTNAGNVGCCNGPFGVAVAATGNIIVSTGAGTSFVFADTNGQTTGSALFTRPSAGGTSAYATAGGEAYGSQFGRYVEFEPDGTVDHILTGVTVSTYLGMWGNPVNGHLIAFSGVGLIDIDPLANGGAGSYRFIAAVGGDGVTVSPDGKTAYVADAGQIVGYNIATGAKTFSSGGFSGLYGPDGTGVISSTFSLNGDLIVNFNGNGVNTGGIGLLDPPRCSSPFLQRVARVAITFLPIPPTAPFFRVFSPGIWWVGLRVNLSGVLGSRVCSGIRRA